MDILRRPVGTYIVIGAVLGVVSLLLGLAKASGLGPVLDILIAATAFAAGFSARTRAGHPAWSGAGVGAVYGVVSGIQAFLRTTTASELKTALQKTHRTSPVSMGKLLTIVNSPVAHLGSLMVAAIIFGLVGLILGAIAGGVAGGREQQRRVV